MRKFYTPIWAIVISVAIFQGCKTPQLLDNSSRIGEETFFNEPFGFTTHEIEQFRKHYPNAKESYVLKRNQHYPEKADTIYKFSKGKSEVFFYRSFSGKTFLLAANIEDRAFPLRNNVQPGISRKVLCKYIQGLPCNGESPYTKKAQSAEFKLFFNSQQELERIFFQYYPD